METVIGFIALACMLAAFVKLREKLRKPEDPEQPDSREKARKEREAGQEFIRTERLRQRFWQRHDNPNGD